MTTADVDLSRWQRLLHPDLRSLRDAARDTEPTDVAAVERLRRAWPPHLVAVALDLAVARRKGARKFPGADALVADPSGVEQATSRIVADHKADRFGALATSGPGAVIDLCCGIGGDAMSLARIADVTAVDASGVRTWMAGHNARCATRAARVEDLDLAGVVFHLDPARREEGGRPGRRWRYEDYRPGPAVIEGLLSRCPDGAIKLGPGVDLAVLPLTANREVEMITEHGTLVQAVLWCGRLARNPGLRTATLLPEGVTFTGAPDEARKQVTPRPGASPRALGQLVLLDPALERAGLTGAFCRDTPLHELHPGLGVFTADEMAPSPWLSSYEVVAEMPWRERKVKAWLGAHGAGIVSVKTRGGAVETDAAQRALRGRGDEAFVVFVLRLGDRRVAVITRG